MLAALFKTHTDARCDCEIVKFVDRIWLEKSGQMSCIRTFIVHVKEKSPAPLTMVRMLTPVRDTTEIFDLSESCLDESYLFNDPRFSAGGYSITYLAPEKDFGHVSYDFFEKVEVCTPNEVKAFANEKARCRVLSVEFPDHPVKPGSFRLIRFTFSATSSLTRIFPRVYSLDMTYFDRTTYSADFDLFNLENLEIPTLVLFDKETKQGGFDVFIHLPPNLSSTNFNCLTQTTSNHLPDGTISEEPTQKFIWRARTMVPAEVETLRGGASVLSISGLINDPYEMEELRSEMGNLKDDLGVVQRDVGSLKRGHKKSLVIGIAALIVGILALLFSFMPSFRDWILGCFK